MKEQGKVPKRFPSIMGEWAKWFLFCIIKWVRFKTIHESVLSVYLGSVMSGSGGVTVIHVWTQLNKMQAEIPSAATLRLNVFKSPSYMCCPVKYQDQLAWWSVPTEGVAQLQNSVSSGQIRGHKLRGMFFYVGFGGSPFGCSKVWSVQDNWSGFRVWRKVR